jgi:L-threonylcarbamoyladenylate synthase
VEVCAADGSSIDRAAELIRAGALVAFPTETVYGLGGDATNDVAVERIFAAKRRPACNPLIVHVADLEAAQRLALFDGRALALARKLWPGPLTLVLPQRPRCPVAKRATAGLPTLALRVPAHPLAHRFLVAAGLPVAAPSANPSGQLSPTSAQHVAIDLAGRVQLVLDGGACPIGLESTVIDLSRPGEATVLRPGGLELDQLERIIGAVSTGGPEAGRPLAPGQLASHYAPHLPVRLDVTEPGPDDALLAFGRIVPDGGRVSLNLSPSGNLAEAAHNLFAMLRQLDHSGAKAIAVMPIPATGLGIAIKDRLKRAAAPRPSDQARQNGLAASR